MSTGTDPHENLPGVIPKPAGAREFTLRAVITGVIVAAIMGASYPYVVLKLGFGPNVSVVAAFFGYLFLGILFKNFTRWENNIVQTAGTSAAQTAFMCVILAAFDLLAQVPGRNYTFSPAWHESFIWLTFASLLGILLAVPLRSHYIEDEKLTYPDGVAAAETIIVLDARGEDAKRAARALFAAAIASAIVWFITTKWGGRLFGVPLEAATWLDFFQGRAHQPGLIVEEVLTTWFGLTIPAMHAGIAVSLLGVGSGMIVGNRINISMAIGAVIAWFIAPKLLVPDVVPNATRGSILLWIMWPGTGMLIAGGLTALFLKWRTLARTFTTMSSRSVQSGDVPLKLIAIGVAICSGALVIIQYAFFDLPFWLTLIAIVVSVPLMLVGLRVLGETNWGPISQLTNMMQAVFAGLVPGNLTANLAASGTTGTIAVQSEAIMQDYKAGHIIGSTPRYLTYAQLLAAPIGAIAVSLSYPAFRDLYGVGGDTGLSAPGSQRIAGFSEVLAEGFDKLPPGAPQFLMIGALIGIVITLLETRWKKWVPSATGLGIGMMVPGSVVLTMVLGGIALSLWRRANRTQADKLSMPLASGLIAGEALAAIIVPLIVAIGLLSANPDPVHAGCGAFGDAAQLIPGCRR
jgi:uncharacterized oligopeptide transporter (OPT) family protein